MDSFQILSISVAHHLSKHASTQTFIQIMNILNVFVLFAILLKCVAASGDASGVAFKEAVETGSFEWLDENWRDWWERGDLLDYVIEKGADFTAKLIQKAENAKDCVLAALFDKGEGMIDDVFGRIKYNDWDLRDLTYYRPELAGSPEKFFRVLDKIKESWSQEWAVQRGVYNLFKAGEHDLVATLVRALGKRTFKSDRLQKEAIQKVFYEGAWRGNQDTVKEYCEHPEITSGEYAIGLRDSWNYGKPNQVFPFLLRQADQGDLDGAKKQNKYKKYEKFRQAIDEAFKVAPPTGSRIISVEKVQHVLAVLASIINVSDEYGPSSIIKEYLLGETEKTKKSEPQKVQEAGTENHTD